MKTKIRLLIVDDHDLLREGIRARLESQPDIKIVGEGSNGEEALAHCEMFKPDIILLDVSMPKMNGLEVAKKITSRNLKTKIIFLSVYNDSEYIAEAMRLGAKGYVLKDVSKPEMLHAIDKVAKGGTYLSLSLDRKHSKAQEAQETLGLTKREVEILALIASGKANKEIADYLKLSVRTVESHRSSIREKTGCKNAIELAKISSDIGIT